MAHLHGAALPIGTPLSGSGGAEDRPRDRTIALIRGAPDGVPPARRSSSEILRIYRFRANGRCGGPDAVVEPPLTVCGREIEIARPNDDMLIRIEFRRRRRGDREDRQGCNQYRHDQCV